MANRLAAETSPYLLQHRDNPVEWQPWGPEALAQARREDRPILLSIGYSSCHWCHVMAHESFEDPGVAEVMNRLFVNIKVDREERPDLDQVYQAALQMLTRRAGGWPLTMFLTPDTTPFYGGTYFPKEARFGLPAFPALLENVAHAYHHRRDDILAQNRSLLESFAATLPEGSAAADMSRRPIDAAVAQIKQGFDAIHGGYGGAPKFPRPAELAFLLQHGDAEARDQVLFTLRQMAAGGLYDQLGGGFYRYSVDERWAIPHFEKMLYDNGPLLGLYADAWAQTGEAVFREVVEATAAWLEREMTSPEGAFFAALDADSEHEEGKFYVWTSAAVEALLAPEESAVVRPYWGLDRQANFEGHAWHLLRARPLPTVAEELGIGVEEAEARLARAQAKLFAARQRRVPPGRDDKVLTSWNALMIAGLARAARRLGRPALLAQARRALTALRRLAWRDGRLRASWKEGEARLNGYLDDHAFLLDALLEMLQTDFHGEDFHWAQEVADALLAHFEDRDKGGFFFTSHDHEHLIHRPKPAFDNATPSGNGVAALALGRLAHLVGDMRYRDASERALRLHYADIAAHPAHFPTLATALGEYLQPPRLVVLRGAPEQVASWRAALGPACPADVLVLAIPTGVASLPPALDKPATETVLAYVCSGVNCLPPIVQMRELLTVLSG